MSETNTVRPVPDISRLVARTSEHIEKKLRWVHAFKQQYYTIATEALPLVAGLAAEYNAKRAELAAMRDEIRRLLANPPQDARDTHEKLQSLAAEQDARRRELATVTEETRRTEERLLLINGELSRLRTEWVPWTKKHAIRLAQWERALGVRLERRKNGVSIVFTDLGRAVALTSAGNVEASSLPEQVSDKISRDFREDNNFPRLLCRLRRALQ